MKFEWDVRDKRTTNRGDGGGGELVNGDAKIGLQGINLTTAVMHVRAYARTPGSSRGTRESR